MTRSPRVRQREAHMKLTRAIMLTGVMMAATNGNAFAR
jgi:hypothetical protein